MQTYLGRINGCAIYSCCLEVVEINGLICHDAINRHLHCVFPHTLVHQLVTKVTGNFCAVDDSG